MMIQKRIIYIAVNICTASLSAFALTESDALFAALNNNADIRIARLDMQDDSLSLESVKAQWLPSLDATVEQQIIPYDSASSRFADYNNPSVSTSAEAKAVQNIPGGGSVTGTIQGERWSYLDTTSVNYSSTVGISVAQPLSKNAWKHSPIDYSLALQRLDNRRFTLEQKKDILASLSAVRNLYWSLFEKQALRTIFAQRQRYAQKHLNTQRTRFTIGNATVLDTLSAHLDFLEATRQLLGARTDAALAQRELGVLLVMPLDSVSVDTAMKISFSDLPKADDFIKLVEGFDPQVQIFEILDTKLRRQMQYKKNQLLPDVTIEAGYTRSLSRERFFDDDQAFSGNAVIALIITYSLPLKDRRIDKAQTSIAARKNTIAKEQHNRDIRQQANELVMTWEQELQTLAIAGASQNIARQQFDAAQAGYAIGTVDQLTLDKAENEYIETAVRLLQKQIVMKKLEIIFDEITGTVLSRFGVKLK